jgi:hypothetical protein
MGVSLTPIGPGIPELVRAVLKSHEDAIRDLQQPQGPVPTFAIASTSLPSAANWIYAEVFCTDLGVKAVSDGTDWLRQDTGAAI